MDSNMMYEDEEFLDESIDFTQEGEKSGIDVDNDVVENSINATWTKDGMKALLSLYEANSHVVENPRKKTKIWAIISKDLYQFGIKKSPDQVRWKMNALQKKYKECIDNNGKSGRGHMTFEYYDKLEEIFQTGRKAAATYTLSSKVIAENSNHHQPKKCESGIAKENNPGNAMESCSKTSTPQQTSNEKLSRKKPTSGKKKDELEEQWLCHLKRVHERQQLVDEKYEEQKKMRIESFKLKKHQIALRERQIDVAEKIAAKKVKLKEKRHEELLEVEQYKCKLLERLLNKPSND